MIYVVTISVIVIISVFIYWFFTPNKWRNIFLLMVSLLLITSYNVKHAIYFLFNAALVYKGGIFLEKNSKNKKNLLKIFLLWLIGNLCFFKYCHKINDMVLFFNSHGAQFPNFKFPVMLFPLGLSYIIFRLVHYVIETYRGSIPRSSFVDFLLYIFFFPTFLAGPVDRFERFHPQAVSEKSINLTDFNSALYRIVCGMIKKFIIADNLARFIMPVLYSPQGYSRLLVACALYGSALRIYMDFAGYTDIALGISKLFGYKIMENFDRPFLKSNIALFWRSWHISVYSWIRDYFFFPLFGSKTSKLKMYLGIFITMIIFHLWHGLSLNFLFLGMYHGVGLLCWYIFHQFKKNNPTFSPVRENKSRSYINIFATFSFVVVGNTFFILNFWDGMRVLLRIINFN